MSAALAILALTGCKLLFPPEPEPPPTPFTPQAEGWVAREATVPFGEPAVFDLWLTWPRPLPEGLVARVSHESYGGPQVTWESEDHVVLSLPTHDPMLVTGAANNVYQVAAIGWLDVCQDVEYGECARVDLSSAYVWVAGGTTTAVMFPVDSASLAIGEARPLQATPIGWRNGLTGPTENANDTVHTQAPVTYESSAPGVFSVDAAGVVRGLTEGEGELIARAAGVEARLPITIGGGTPEPLPEGVWPLTTRWWGTWPYSDTGRDDSTFDVLAFAPDGDLLALSRAEVAEFEGRPHVTLNNPLHLVRWTGTGWGYERVSGWEDAVSEAFLEVDLEGRTYIGWRSHTPPGLVVLDRGPDEGPGGWRRRVIPGQPHLDELPSPEIPLWDPETPVRVATLPGEGGIWVAFGWGQGVDPPAADWPTRCLRFLRLAKVGADGIQVEDAVHEFFEVIDDSPYECNEAFGWHRLPEWGELRLGPPPTGSPKPVITVEDGAVYGYGLTGWTRVDGALGDALAVTADAWSPGADPDGDVLTSMSRRGRGVTAPDGRVWTIGAHPDLWTLETPWRARPDSPFGPHFPGDYALGRGAEQPYAGFAGGYGRFAMLTYLEPPGAPARELWEPLPMWLYVTDLRGELATPDAPLETGRRLSDTYETPFLPGAAALSDGRVVLWRGAAYHELLGGRDLDRVMVVDEAESAAGDTSPGLLDERLLFGETRYWSAGDRLLVHHRGGETHTLYSSDDAGLTLTLRATWTSLLPAVAFASSDADTHWVLTADRYTRELRRIEDDGEAAWTPFSEPVPGGAEGMLDPDTAALWPDGAGGLWALTVGGWDLKVSTSHWTPEGGFGATQVATLGARPRIGQGGLVQGDILVIPVGNDLRVSHDGGASFEVSGLRVPNDVRGPGLVSLSDGRGAWVGDERVTAGQRVSIWTTEDGLAWGGPTPVRPQGGAWQSAWAAAPLADGSLFVHMGDSQTLMGDAFVQGSGTGSGLTAYNPTELDGIAIRLSP